MSSTPAPIGHTPGPWSYRQSEYDDWGTVRSASGGFICQAHDPDIWSGEQLARHRAAKTDPWEANARLIAAAPELLEALRNLADRHFLNGGSLTEPAYLAAKAAIRKATEQSS